MITTTCTALQYPSILRVVRDAIRGWSARRRLAGYIVLTLPIAFLGGLLTGRVNTGHWRVDWFFVVLLEALSFLNWSLNRWWVRQ